MGRIRTIKPEFWTSEQVMECSPIARLMFIGLWNFCDDAGRQRCSAKQIKALIFPSDDITVESIRRIFDELSTNGLVDVYSVDDKEYFQVTGWKHQRIDKPQPSKFPGPFDERSKSVRKKASTDRIGEDRKGEERKEDSSSTKRVDGPSDWPSDYAEQFWQQYPRKVGKKSALKKLGIVCRSGEVAFLDLMAAVSRYAAAADPAFVSHPETWLNKGRWTDDPASITNGRVQKVSPLMEAANRLVEESDRRLAEFEAREFGNANGPIIDVPVSKR